MVCAHPHDIPRQDTFLKIEPIHKGWSSDKKYYIETTRGEKLLLRVANISEMERKQKEFDVMKRIVALGIPMSQPLDFGTCDNGASVFTLLTWCEGEEATDALPKLAETEQYAIGYKAGETLRKIHTIETYAASPDWAVAKGKQIDSYIESYQTCGMTFDGDELLLNYVQQNRHLIDKRPRCLTHSDFHVGNLVISPEKELFVIDFQRCGITDPFAAFTSIMFSAVASPHFATGQIRGYFGGEPPEDFWPLLAFYLAAVNIHALPWSIRFGQKEIDYAYGMLANVFRWFDNLNNPVPTWYHKEFGGALHGRKSSLPHCPI